METIKYDKGRLLVRAGVALTLVLMALAVSLALTSAANGGAPACPCGDTPTVIDSIDIGNTTSEAGHNMQGWGPPEPATNGGTWGNVANPSEDGTCRVTWEPPTPTNNKRAASFTLKVPAGKLAQKLELRVLDGQADDSFEVYVNNTQVYTYTGLKSGTEQWINHTIDLTGMKGTMTVKIKATGPAWSLFGTYGQLGVEWAKLYGYDALDYVDIGDPKSEGSDLSGWGPVEPATHGGTWGGIAPGNTRVTWEPGKGDLYRDARIKMTVPKGLTAKTLKLRALDGQGNDSYMVLVNNELVYWFVAPHAGKTQSEEWFTDSIDLTSKFPSGLTGTVNVVIVATGPAWAQQGTYGQLAFDWALLCP